MTIEKKVGLVGVFHPFEEGAKNAERILDDGLTFLEGCSARIISAPKLVSNSSLARDAGLYFKKHDVNAIIVLLATWSDDRLLLEMLAHHDVPVINWGIRSMDSGSLCGSHQFNMVLKELGKESYLIFERDDDSMAQLNAILEVTSSQQKKRPASKDPRVQECIDGLEHLKVAIIGSRTQGMMEVACDEFSVKEVLGPTILSFSLDYFKGLVRGIDEGAAKKGLRRFKKTHPRVKVSIDEKTFLDSIKIHLALEKLIDEHELGAISIECYPRYMGKTCLGFSLLADAGVPCSCEGDVHAAILMWLISKVSGFPTNHIDLLDVDLERNTITGGHCGSCGFQLANNDTVAELAPVRLAGEGCSVVFPARAGHVVLANLVGRKGSYRAFILKGEALPVDLVFPGNPARVKLSIPVKAFLEKVGEHGFGHHWIVGYISLDDDHYGLLVKILERLGILVIR